MFRRRPRGPWLVALIITLSLWSIAACDPFASEATPGPTAEATDRPTDEPTEEPTAEPTAGSATVPDVPQGETEEALVTRVVDGDTIEVEIDGQPFTVRYLGIDAPALAETSADGQDEPLARQAQAANRGLVGDQTILLERDESDTDDDGRLLRYVWVDVNGTLRLVNHVLLARGFGVLLTVPPDTRYADAFAAAEESARARSAGLWAPDAAEPSSTPEPIVVEDETSVGVGQTAFRGAAGTYRWTTITFASDHDILIRWSATSTSGACEMTWTLSGANGSSGRAAPTEPGQANGRTTLQSPDAGSGELVVSSSCAKWLITFNEVLPPPTPEPTPEPTPQPTGEETEAPSVEPSAEPSAGESVDPFATPEPTAEPSA